MSDNPGLSSQNDPSSPSTSAARPTSGPPPPPLPPPRRKPSPPRSRPPLSAYRQFQLRPPTSQGESSSIGVIRIGGAAGQALVQEQGQGKPQNILDLAWLEYRKRGAAYVAAAGAGAGAGAGDAGGEDGEDAPRKRARTRGRGKEREAQVDEGEDTAEVLPCYGLDRDGRPYKPNVTHAEMLRIVLEGSLDKELQLPEIYEAIETRWPYFKDNNSNWKGSIRHNLSSHKQFIATEQRDAHGVKLRGQLWTMNPDCHFDDGGEDEDHQDEHAQSQAARSAAGVDADGRERPTHPFRVPLKHKGVVRALTTVELVRRTFPEHSPLPGTGVLPKATSPGSSVSLRGPAPSGVASVPNVISTPAVSATTLVPPPSRRRRPPPAPASASASTSTTPALPGPSTCPIEFHQLSRPALVRTRPHLPDSDTASLPVWHVPYPAISAPLPGIPPHRGGEAPPPGFPYPFESKFVCPKFDPTLTDLGRRYGPFSTTRPAPNAESKTPSTLPSLHLQPRGIASPHLLTALPPARTHEHSPAFLPLDAFTDFLASYGPTDPSARHIGSNHLDAYIPPGRPGLGSGSGSASGPAKELAPLPPLPPGTLADNYQLFRRLLDAPRPGFLPPEEVEQRKRRTRGNWRTPFPGPGEWVPVRPFVGLPDGVEGGGGLEVWSDESAGGSVGSGSASGSDAGSESGVGVACAMENGSGKEGVSCAVRVVQGRGAGAGRGVGVRLPPIVDIVGEVSRVPVVWTKLEKMGV